MTDFSLVDPELRPLVENFPVFTYDRDNLPTIRTAFTQLMAAAGGPEPQEQFAPGPAGAPDVRVLIWRPSGVAAPLPAILHIHGGGYVIGAPEMNATQHGELTEALNCIVVSVDYRLAPEAPYPAPLEDCYAALKWTYDNADSLGIDSSRLGIAGESAGGGLAAGLALLARDRAEVPIAFQHLIYPMLDDRTCITEEPHPYTGTMIWTAESNRFGWTSYLGHSPGGENVDCYAAPARATNLRGLPPTYLSVGALDLFLDENMDYALRLTRAGVPVEFHLYPAAYHGFDMAPGTRLAAEAQRNSRDALTRFFTQ